MRFGGAVAVAAGVMEMRFGGAVTVAAGVIEMRFGGAVAVAAGVMEVLRVCGGSVTVAAGARVRLGGGSVPVAAGARWRCGAATAVCILTIAICVSRIAIRRPLCGCGLTEGGIGAWHGVEWTITGPMVVRSGGGLGRPTAGSVEAASVRDA